MDPDRNPYIPPPPVAVGRDREVQSWRAVMERVESGREVRPVAVQGVHGVGKTVLLREFRRAAEDRDWLVLAVDAGQPPSLAVAVATASQAVLKQRRRAAAGYGLRTALESASAFAASHGRGARRGSGATQGSAASLAEDLRTLLHDLAEAAVEDRVGVALLIDDAQEMLPAEMQAVCAAARDARENAWGLLVALAAPPGLLPILDAAAWYAQWLFATEDVPPLPDEAARELVVAPAGVAGVEWDEEAVALVLRAARGYPSFLRAFAQASWNLARGKRITVAGARAGIASGQQVLDAAFAERFWSRTTAFEKRYLQEMAVDGAECGSSVVAARLGRTNTSLGPTRARLLAKRLIYVPRRGVVAFTAGGIEDFIRRQAAA